MTARQMVLVAALVTPAACSTGAAGGAGDNRAPKPVAKAIPGYWDSGSVAIPGAGERRYALYVPMNHDATRPHMLVVLLHGCTQDPQDIARGTRITDHADREQFLVLLPEQPESANSKKCWNWYDPAHQSRGRGEPELIDLMIGRVLGHQNVDSNRIHIAGISAGAAMAANVAVAYPERYASVAFHSGIPWRAATNVMEALAVMKQAIPDASQAVKLGAAAVNENRDRARAIPALIIHGGKDPVVNPANARSLTTQWLSMLGTVGHPASFSLEKMSATRDSGVTNGYRWTKASLMQGDVVELIIDELGHAWSGGSPEGTFTDPKGPDATAEIVRFFRAHPKKDK